LSRRADRNADSVLHRLSRAPDGSWGARLSHHGARLLLVVGLAGMVAVFFPPARGTEVLSYVEGMVATEDVIATVPFSVPKTPAELEAERRSVMDAVPPTFDFLPEVTDSVMARLHGFFDQLDSASAQGDRGRVDAILRGNRIIATPSQVDFIRDAGSRAAFRAAAVLAADQVLRRGVVAGSLVDGATTSSVTVREAERPEHSMPVGDILTSRDFLDQAAPMLPSGTPPEASLLFNLILIGHIDYTLVLNVVATEMDRGAASRSVSPTKANVLEGQAIVRQADPIGPEALERLTAYEDELRALGLIEAEALGPGALFGAVMVNVMMFALFGLLLFFNRPEVYANFRWLLLIALLVAAYFGAAVLIDRNELAAEWLPIAFVALPVAVLWDSRMSLFLVLILVATTGTLAPFSAYGSVLALMVAGAAAAMSVRAVRRRSETWLSIAIISVAGGVMLFSHGLATSGDMGAVLRGSAALAGNATVSALLAMGFLFVFELFTGITTDQTLLEWADPTRPLLRRLSLEAPGTYAHSINVANLAESAATEIGANGLLSRVGVYYHDVGKMLKPHYFVENQTDGRNPHDKLKPETSAAIVREHVTEGVRLAKDAKVPAVVLQFILEHHGTQPIGFFYEKAREESGDEVDPERFSYPGPKPQSRETAIVMLADSCESATRAMREPTPERVRDLIENIFEGKIAQGQLDEAPLTMGEITQVKDQFVKILAGVLHRRIEYPTTKHLTEAEHEGTEPTDDSGAVAVPAFEDVT
jgi:cyclic-di-AMP phosphodiesterase PgpH